jgi:hypothetical protein
LNNYLKEDFKELHGILNNRQEELAIKRKIEKENKPYRKWLKIFINSLFKFINNGRWG